MMVSRKFAGGELTTLSVLDLTERICCGSLDEHYLSEEGYDMNIG
jgi:hypothetical protein